MSDDKPISAGDKKQVSKARKIVSGIVLLGLLVLLGIEGRAGFGHSMTANALKSNAPEGVFKAGAVTEEAFNGKLALWPIISEIGETKTTVECKYEWFSIFRPRMEKLPPAVLYATFSNTEPRYAMFYGTEPPDTAERIELTKDTVGDTGRSSMSIFDDEPIESEDGGLGGQTKDDDAKDDSTEDASDEDSDDPPRK